jgi:hypothetical protein
LNPLRVKLVADLKELEKYPYCGHGVILGTVKVDILRRRVDASVLLIKALGGGWKVADLPQL